MEKTIHHYLIVITILFISACSSVPDQMGSLQNATLTYEPYEIEIPNSKVGLMFDVTLASPTSELDIPKFVLKFAGDRKRLLAVLDITDPICKGEHDLSIK